MGEMLTVTNSASETRALGEQLASGLRPGDTVILEGELGAGKSELARGIARGLFMRADAARCIILTGTGWRAKKNCTSSAWTNTWAATGSPWWNGRNAARTRFRRTVSGSGLKRRAKKPGGLP